MLIEVISKMEGKKFKMSYMSWNMLKIYRTENDLKRPRVGWKKPDPGKGD